MWVPCDATALQVLNDAHGAIGCSGVTRFIRLAPLTWRRHALRRAPVTCRQPQAQHRRLVQPGRLTKQPGPNALP